MKKMFSNAEIMAIVTVSTLLMSPALLGYIELVLWVNILKKKRRYKENSHEQDKKA